MKRQVEKTNCDCYIVIDSVRNTDRVSLYCIKEATEKYHVFEEYTLYDGEMSFEDGVWNRPFTGLKNSHPMSRRKYARLADEIKTIKEKVVRMSIAGTIVRRDSLKAGDCIKYSNGYMKFVKIEDNEFEASGLSIDKWCARHCSRITGCISEHLPEEVFLIEEKELRHAEKMLRSSVEALKNDIINEYMNV